MNDGLGTHAKTAPPGAPALPVRIVRETLALLDQIPWSIPALALRLFPAAVFWQSGRTRVEGVSLKQSTLFLFEHEYALPLIDCRLAATLATIAEHVLPVLLVLGLATRFSALGLLVMTALIQVLVYPGAWVTNDLWAACLRALIAKVPGIVSVDRWIVRRFAYVVRPIEARPRTSRCEKSHPNRHSPFLPRRRRPYAGSEPTRGLAQVGARACPSAKENDGQPSASALILCGMRTNVRKNVRAVLPRMRMSERPAR